MPPRSRPARSLLPILAACLTLGIAGCGTDDIQFNGGIFDAVGLSDNSKSKGGDPKMAERAPLVVPPTLDRLPPPGEAPPQTQIADIKDPDAQKKLSHAELEAKQAEYCKVNYENVKARGDDSADSAEGPLGPCRKSVLTAIKKWNGDDEAEGQ
jgi:hypothetical protein